MLASLRSLMWGKRRFQDLSVATILTPRFRCRGGGWPDLRRLCRQTRGNTPLQLPYSTAWQQRKMNTAGGLSSSISTVRDFVVPMRREHVADFYTRRPVWLVENWASRNSPRGGGHGTPSPRLLRRRRGSLDRCRDTQASGRSAAAEAGHQKTANNLAEHIGDEERRGEDLASRRQFVLTWVQPGLAGLMDGSVSTLAPIFATAFATQNTWTTFLVGLSAAVGAGISMGFTEAAHDDGKLSGRGSPWKRGLGHRRHDRHRWPGHALPYLIPPFLDRNSSSPLIVVFVELWAIVWIQNRYMETPFFVEPLFKSFLAAALS